MSSDLGSNTFTSRFDFPSEKYAPTSTLKCMLKIYLFSYCSLHHLLFSFVNNSSDYVFFKKLRKANNKTSGNTYKLNFIANISHQP